MQRKKIKNIGQELQNATNNNNNNNKCYNYDTKCYNSNNNNNIKKITSWIIVLLLKCYELQINLENY